MNASTLPYLQANPRVPKPHAREGIRYARKFNETTARLCEEALTAELCAELERELSVAFAEVA